MGELEQIIRLNYDKQQTEVKQSLTIINTSREWGSDKERETDRERDTSPSLIVINKDLMNAPSVWAEFYCDGLVEEWQLLTERAQTKTEGEGEQ